MTENSCDNILLRKNVDTIQFIGLLSVSCLYVVSLTLNYINSKLINTRAHTLKAHYCCHLTLSVPVGVTLSLSLFFLPGKKSKPAEKPFHAAEPPDPVLPGSLAIGSVSLALAKSGAQIEDVPLYRYIGALKNPAVRPHTCTNTLIHTNITAVFIVRVYMIIFRLNLSFKSPSAWLLCWAVGRRLWESSTYWRKSSWSLQWDSESDRYSRPQPRSDVIMCLWPTFSCSWQPVLEHASPCVSSFASCLVALMWCIDVVYYWWGTLVITCFTCMKHTELQTSSTDRHNDPWITEGDDENNKHINKSWGEGHWHVFTVRIRAEL